MKRLSIKQAYSNENCLLFFSGEYFIIDKSYYLIFIADFTNTIYDIVLYNTDEVEICKNYLIILGEKFEKVGK